jgi:uncharacterized protein (TIGR03437 family)
MPVRICWRYSDKAGNYADPAAFDFGPPAVLPNAVRNAASLVRGPVAAGSVFRADTFNLTDRAEFSPVPVDTLAGVRASLRDSAGRVWRVRLTTAGPLYVEGVMPDDAMPGSGTFSVQPPEGPALSQPMSIGGSAPGIYWDGALGAPRGYASDSKGNVYEFVTCPSQRQCSTTHLPLSSAPGGLDFIFYGTGLRASLGPIKVHIGTYEVGAMVHPHPGITGVDDLHFHLPSEFPLRLFQTISAETPDGWSNHLWIYLE